MDPADTRSLEWDDGRRVLKYFGWNFIGGDDEVLGRRYDAGIMPSSVKIYGKVLPAITR